MCPRPLWEEAKQDEDFFDKGDEVSGRQERMSSSDMFLMRGKLGCVACGNFEESNHGALDFGNRAASCAEVTNPQRGRVSPEPA